MNTYALNIYDGSEYVMHNSFATALELKNYTCVTCLKHYASLPISLEYSDISLSYGIQHTITLNIEGDNDMFLYDRAIWLLEWLKQIPE